MREKVDRLVRIERLRRQIHEIAAWKLAIVTQEREKLAETHAEMVAALGEGLMAYGAPALAATRSVRAMERRLAVAGAIEKDLAAKAMAQGRLAKLAEGSLETARDAHQAQLDRRDLEALIEASVASASRKP